MLNVGMPRSFKHNTSSIFKYHKSNNNKKSKYTLDDSDEESDKFNKKNEKEFLKKYHVPNELYTSLE